MIGYGGGDGGDDEEELKRKKKQTETHPVNTAEAHKTANPGYASSF